MPGEPEPDAKVADEGVKLRMSMSSSTFVIT